MVSTMSVNGQVPLSSETSRIEVPHSRGPALESFSMMTSSNGNIFRVTGPFVRGIHRPPVDSPHKGQWRRALHDVFFDLRPNKR